MALSQRHRQQLAEIELEAAKELAKEVGDTVAAVRESSEVLRRVDPDLIRGYLTREIAIDPTAHAAWEGRAEKPEHMQAITKRAAQRLEAAVERLHGDGGGDDDGVAEKDVAQAVRMAREIAGMDGRVPSSLIESVFAAASSADDNFVKSWNERESAPGQWNGALRSIAFRTREVVDALSNATRPAPTLPEGLDMKDLADMSEAEWTRYKRFAMKSQGGGK
jgi:hypothetical protein